MAVRNAPIRTTPDRSASEHLRPGSVPEVSGANATAELTPDAAQQMISTSLFDCEVDIPHPATFRASLKTQHFAGLDFVEVACGPHLAHRGRDRVNRADESAYLAVLQLGGVMQVTQEGRTASLRPGELCFIDSSRPVDVEVGDNLRAVGVKFPGQMLSYPRKTLCELTARTVRADRGVASTVCSMLLALNQTIGTIETTYHYKMVRGVVEMVETMFSSIDLNGHEGSAARELQVDQIKDYLEARLGDTDLTPKHVADAHYISVRQLHYLFQETGVSMSAWVRARRLERCLADLADPRLEHLQISAIARTWGFHSSSHFGQVVRTATGLSPKQFRCRAVDAIGDGHGRALESLRAAYVPA